MSSPTPPRHSSLLRRQWSLPVGALLFFILLAAFNSLTTPLFEPPDELYHYQFVVDWRRDGQLPVQTPDGPVSQSHQPPLYYLGALLVTGGVHDPHTLPARNPYWGYDGAGIVSADNKLQFVPNAAYAPPFRGTALVVHLMRGWSVLLSAGTVLVVWLLGRRLWPNRPGRQTLLLALVAANPMFLYIAGAANNDNLIIFLGALLLWLVVRAVQDGFSWPLTIAIGLVWGLALLAKLTGLVLAASWGTALLLVSWKGRAPAVFFSRLAGIVATATAVSGWWFLRNWRIYRDPLALEIVLDVWGEREAARRTLPILWGDLQYSWTNFWGRFGYGQIPLPDWIYFFFLLLTIIALIGLIRRLRESGLTFTPTRRILWLVLAATATAYIGALFYYIFRNPTGANGRYIFPALPAVAAMLTAPIAAALPRRLRWSLLPAAGLGLLAVFISVFYLPAIYAPPPPLTPAMALEQIEQPADLLWDGRIRLLGTTVTPRAVTTGDTVNVTACWQTETALTENHTLYVRLLDHQFNPLGVRDTYPGLGTFPTTLWEPGRPFCETIPVPVTTPVTQPLAAHIDVGFYQQESGEQLPAVNAAGTPVEIAIIDRIKVRPQTAVPPPPPTQTTAAEFGGMARLIGYNLSAAQLKPGDTFSVDLYWEAFGPFDQSYSVFAHLLSADGVIISQADSLPAGGAYPTTFWGAGEQIVDTHTFVLPPDTPAGATTISVGFYLLSDFSRLPRTDGGPLPDAVQVSGPTISERDQ